MRITGTYAFDKNRFYDKDKNYLGSGVQDTNWRIKTVGVSTRQAVQYTDIAYVRFEFDTTTVELVKAGAAFAHGDSCTSVTPYSSTTLPVPDAVRALDGYGWGISDTVYNRVDYENKVFRKLVGRVDLGTLTYSAQSSYSGIEGHYRYNFTVKDIDASNSGIRWLSILPNAHISDVRNNGAVGLVYYVSSDDAMRFETTDYSTASGVKSAMSGVYLYYELETPVETDISDLLADAEICEPVECESGGTVIIRNDNLLATPNTEEYLIALAEVNTDE